MSTKSPGPTPSALKKTALIVALALIALGLLCSRGISPAWSTAERETLSDHFDGNLFFNPGTPPAPSSGEEPRRSRAGWIWRWLFGSDWPQWPQVSDITPAEPPPARVPRGALLITPVGHATFLIQMDGVNILTDPIWSERCSPVSWAGPKRHRPPGVPFEALPPIDMVLLSHNHYDHLDLPTLSRLAKKGVRRAATPLGNRALVRSSGLEEVAELDWWQSIPVAEEITVTLVPARHFSSRTLWDRNETLWGGFVLSGPSGHVYFAGDTAHGPHFSQIAQRFSPVRAALLPLAPFRPPQSNEPPRGNRPEVHMGPVQAIQAHLDLAAEISIAAHFQVFQLGADGFEDAVNLLQAELERRGLKPELFLTPRPGQPVALAGRPAPLDVTGRISAARAETQGGL